MNKERLEKLAHFLPTVPEKNFDLTWFALDGFDPTVPDCGTTGCACGWATAIFSELKLRHDQDCQELSLCYTDGSHNDLTACEVASTFFDINEEQFQYLFNYDNEATPSEVSERILGFVANNGEIDYNDNDDYDY